MPAGIAGAAGAFSSGSSTTAASVVNNIEATEELIIKPHMYNQRNNSSLIFCAQNKEIIIVCGKIHIRTKTLMYSFLFLIMIILLIWIYNTFMKHSQ